MTAADPTPFVQLSDEQAFLNAIIAEAKAAPAPEGKG